MVEIILYHLLINIRIYIYIHRSRIDLHRILLNCTTSLYGSILCVKEHNNYVHISLWKPCFRGMNHLAKEEPTRCSGLRYFQVPVRDLNLSWTTMPFLNRQRDMTVTCVSLIFLCRTLLANTHSQRLLIQTSYRALHKTVKPPHVLLLMTNIPDRIQNRYAFYNVDRCRRKIIFVFMARVRGRQRTAEASEAEDRCLADHLRLSPLY
jgi:hypothetical protein